MMTPDVGQEGPEDIRMVKNIVVNLVDSVVYSERASEVKSEVERLKGEVSDRLSRVNEVSLNVSSALKRYEEEESIKAFADTKKQITDFSSMALEQYKKKLEKLLNENIKEKEGEMASDETRATRSLETFLAKDPLPLEELGITVKATEGGYEGRARYRCGEGIRYEFSLNTKNVEIFRNLLEFEDFAKGVKMPVRLAGSWIAKEPAIDYEKMGKYYMASSEFSKDHLITVFTNREKESEFRFVYTKSEETAFVHVEYKDKAEAVDITSQPALNKNLDADAIRDSLAMLADAMTNLENNKQRLAKLTLNDEDLLAELRYYDFLVQVIKLLGPNLRESFEYLIKKGDNLISEKKNGDTDRDYIRSRFGLLKEYSDEIIKMLEIEDLLSDRPE